MAGPRGGHSRTHPTSYYSPPRRVEVDELSSLPSPSSSVVDLDSNAGTVETDILLSSYKGNKPEGKKCIVHVVFECKIVFLSGQLF